MLEHVDVITAGQLLTEVQQLHFEGYRFVTLSCVSLPDGGTEMIYTFDRDLLLRHLRFTARADERVPSISCIYLAAMLVENEVKELFGVAIADIVVDYDGHLLLSDGAPTAPMAGGQLIIERRA